MKISQISYVHVNSLRGGDTFLWFEAEPDFTWGDAMLTFVDPIVLIKVVECDPGAPMGDWDDLLEDLREVQDMKLLIAFDG